MTAPLLPDHSKLHRVLHITCAFLEAQQLDYALVGGLAFALWGQPRTTFDVDLVVAGGADRVEPLRSAIRQEAAFLLEPETLSLPPHTFVLRAHVLDAPSAEPDVILVDFLFLDPLLTQEILRRRVAVDLAGRQVWICSAEDLILLKLIAGREKDLLDAKGVLRARSDRLDFAYLEPWVERLGCQQKWVQVKP